MALKNLFRKPEWQQRDPSRRAHGVARSKDPALLAALPDIARDDNDPQVRKAAIERLNDFYLDMRLAYEDGDPAIRELSMARYRNTLMASDEPAAARLSNEERIKLLGRLEDRDLLDQIRRHASRSDIRQTALETLSETRFNLDSAAHDPDPRVRRAASDHIKDEATLSDLAEKIQRSDKALYRHLRDRLQKMAIARGDTNAVAERAASLCKQMEALMLQTRHLDAQHFDAINNDWQAISNAVDDATQQRFQRAHQVVGIACGRIDAPKRPVSEPPQSEPMAPQSEQPASETTTQSTEPEAEPESDPEPDAGLVELSNELAESDANQNALRDWRKRLSTYRKGLNPPINTANQQLLDSINRRLNEIEDRLKAQRDEALASLEQQLDILESSLEARQLLPAAEAEHGIQDLQKAVKDWPRGLQRRWQTARKQLSELRSWQRWADNRVRESLCEQAEALLVDKPHPDALSEKLRQLREQWQKLDQKEAATEPSGKPSGGVLRRRFHQATRSAHDQAKPFFEKRQQVRAIKTDQLEDLAQSIEAMANDLANPDWKLIEQRISEGRRALRELPETLPKARKALAERLRNASAGLEEHLRDHQERVARIKQGLIEKAEKLSDMSPSEASKQAGELMQQWKQAGSAGRRREQSLWKPFRAALDGARERLDQQHQQDREQYSAARDRIKDALTSLQQSLDVALDSTQELAAGARAEFEQAWQADQSAADPALKKQRQQLIEQIDQHHAKLAQQKTLAQFDALIHQSEALHELELQRLDGGDAEAPPDLAPELAQRGKAIQLDDAALKAHAAELKSQAETLTLRCEIEAELPSPETWQKQRMDLQVNRLNERMAGGDDESGLDTLIRHWHSLGPLDRATWDELRPRMAAVEKTAREQL